MHPTLLIDGRWVSFSPGQTILEAAQSVGIHIPNLCYYKEGSHCDVCRICVVEVEGSERLLPACSTQVREGMEVWTNTERVAISRQRTIDMLLASGRHGCLACAANGDCRLQDLAYAHGAVTSEHWPHEDNFPKAFDDPFILRDYSKCILCGRCIAACMDVQINGAIKNPFGRRGGRSGSEGWFPLPDPARCVECGQCVEACPVGALREKSARETGRHWEMDKVRTTCPHCGVGCQQLVHVNDGGIARVTAVPGAFPDKGRLCVKGRFRFDFPYSEKRLTSPLIKKNGKFRKASWDEALDFVTRRIKDIIGKNGPDSVAGICSARATNESSYNMQKLFRGAIGTNNIDNIGGASALPISSGLSIAGLADARMLLCIGADMSLANPVAATFVKNAVRNGAELILAESKYGSLVKHALLVAKINEGSEAAFVNGLMRVIIEEGLYNKDLPDGFDGLKSSMMKYTPEHVAEVTGVDSDIIMQIARRFASAKPAVACYSPGDSGAAREIEVSIANLQALVGNIGDGGGVITVHARNNARGASDMGVLPGMLPGYQKVSDKKARENFAKAWGVPGIPDKPGFTLPQMLESLTNGSVKAVYCFGEDPAKSSPESGKAFAAAEFMVCQDTTLTETGRLAEVVLPSETWGEEDGTYTNGEQRVSRVRKFKEPSGAARPGWWIFREIAKRMGYEWEPESAMRIWDDEVTKLIPAFDGIKYNLIEDNGIQWLHRIDSESARGRRMFIPCE